MTSLCQRARHLWQDLAMGKPQEGKEAHQARSQRRFAVPPLWQDWASQEDCWKRQREEQGASSAQGQRQNGHDRGAQDNVACAAIQTAEGDARVLDSGASRRIAMRPVPPETTITFGNGSKASVEAVGDVVLRITGQMPA